MPLGECGLTCRAHSKAMSTVYSYDRKKIAESLSNYRKRKKKRRSPGSSVGRASDSKPVGTETSIEKKGCNNGTRNIHTIK